MAPLIAWTIEHAKPQNIDDIILSSDSENYGEKHGQSSV